MQSRIKPYVVRAAIGFLIGFVCAVSMSYFSDDVLHTWTKVPSWEMFRQSYVAQKMNELAMQAFALRFCETLLTYGFGLLLFPPALLCGLKAFRAIPDLMDLHRRVFLSIEITIYVLFAIATLATLLVAATSHPTSAPTKFTLDFIGIVGALFLGLWSTPGYPLIIGGFIFVLTGAEVHSCILNQRTKPSDSLNPGMTL